MTRVGLIGFGFAGRIFHAPVVSAVEGLELAAIVERSGAAAASAYPMAKVVRTVEELLSDTSIRLIVVATPNSSHFSIARQCLLADRDVVIDKPFALHSAEAAELIRLARSRGRQLTVYHNRRWDGDFRTVQQLLNTGKLGRLVLFESHFDRFRPVPNLRVWRESGGPGGGILVDLGSHLVDQALTLFGLPQIVEADVRIEREGGRTDDAFDLCLCYPQHSAGNSAGPETSTRQGSHAGLRVWLRSSCIALDSGPRFILNGTRGSYRKFGFDPQESRLKAGDFFTTKPWGTESEDLWGTLAEDVEGNIASSKVPTEPGDYRAFYVNVRDALLGDAPLEVNPVQAWNTMRLLEMAVESSSRRSSVECDWSYEL